MNISIGPDTLKTDFRFVTGDIRSYSNQIKSTSLIDKINSQSFSAFCVYFSGGLDSTILLSLIIKELLDTDKFGSIPLITVTVDKGEGQMPSAFDVLQEIQKIYGVEIKNRVYKNKDGYEHGRIHPDTYRIIRHQFESMYKDVLFYQGVNNPPDSKIKTFNSTFRGYGSHEVLSFSDNSALAFPFLNLHKPQIVDLGYKIGCDSAFQYTQSCTEQASGNCGCCYWCEERQWAFDMLEKTDPIM